MTAYLLLVIVGFSLFGVCLFYVWIWSNLPGRSTPARAAAKPSPRLAATPEPG